MRYDLGGIGGGGTHITVNLHDQADIKADFTDLDSFCEDDSVDEFYLSHSLEHIPTSKYAQFLKDMLRKLKPGGCVRVVQSDVKRSLEMYLRGELSFFAVRTIIFPPADRILRNPYNQHFNMWGAEELASDFSAVGYDTVEIFDAGAWRMDTTDELRPGEVERFHHVVVPNLGVEARRAAAPLTPAVRIIEDLPLHEKRLFSQNGEDGVTLYLLDLLGIKNGFYLEIGTQDGTECNCRVLREHLKFDGLMLDADFENPAVGLYKEFVTCENIVSLCDEYRVPHEIAVLSIDIDGNDYWLWRAISERVRAALVIIEYNPALGPQDQRVMPYTPSFRWQGTDYYGASISALASLGRTLGYRLVHADANGVNLFFVRDKILNQLGLTFANADEPARLYRPPNYYPNGGGHPPDFRKVPLFAIPQLIPKIIHQTWRTTDIPSGFRQAWRESWQEMNPAWEYRFWTDEDIDAFVREQHPSFYPVFKKYDVAIKRVDAFRYLLMKSIGGVYADLDSICLKPLDPILDGEHLVVGAQLSGDWQKGHEHICNAFIASMPEDPFWDGITVDLARHASHYVLDATGPNFLTGRMQRSLAFLDETSLPKILEKSVLYPFLWNEPIATEARGWSRKQIADKFPDAVSATFWTASWK